MKTVLLRDFNFNEASIDQFIRQMKATFEFANLAEYDATSHEPGGSNTDENGDGEEEALPKYKPRKPIDKPSAEIRELTLPLFGGGMAFLQTPYPLSEENFDYMMMQLGNWKKALIEKKVDEGNTAEGHSRETT